ncbi:MAG: hypothetical protein V1799_17890 [bacterium]
MAHQHPLSFGRYETYRILIPGFYFTTLLSLLFWSAFPYVYPVPLFSELIFIILFSTILIIAGLSLYAKETTKRRKAFLENQPSQYLQGKVRTMADVPVLEDDEARRLYFYILNNHIPATFHEKIFFFGTVYHIMIQIRRTSFGFALLGTAMMAIFLSAGMTMGSLHGLVIFTAAVWLVYLLNVRYNKADRKMQENYQDQIYWLQMHNDLIEEIIRKRSTSPTQSV